jgi:DNA repair exonuclease SbcCD nuclease subunit
MNKFAGEINSTDIPGDFNYYAMGHYHDHIEKRYANLGGPLVYPGSLDLTPSEGIKEVEKGFALVDMSGADEASVQFIPLHRRPQFSIRIDYAKMKEGIEEAMKKASSYSGIRPVAKVEVEGRNIDPRAVSDSLLRLNEVCLHYVWQSVDEQSQALAFDERPADLDAELLRLSKDALGAEEPATVAIRDLLPPAAAGDAGAALEIVWDIFKKRSSAAP